MTSSHETLLSLMDQWDIWVVISRRYWKLLCLDIKTWIGFDNVTLSSTLLLLLIVMSSVVSVFCQQLLGLHISFIQGQGQEGESVSAFLASLSTVWSSLGHIPTPELVSL
jgi:hypothetical protein